ncbi:MAG: NADH:flavin oxidoreductase/NADH oxidase [Bradyrhizobium sp.]|uniref:NADH:flavin oxidoreductase/NADH oxidase n=1 Tax=Bradyrhizobium sp. TaxID=376 RepID=UPI001D71CF13|nr:NADH:flavin oxidoreductase/NADH oxidase [Bradyrhizobium sp.]MBV9563690.1 NADH:flavin oxidoreductase/NADH oxidase [Bradyrhizobium sp.]
MSEFSLFSPFTIRGVTLRNRIVVPPMHQYSAVKGFPTDWHLMNAGKFAAGGAGLVIVESTKVERRGCGTVGDLGIWDDVFIAPLRRIAGFIKEQNAVAGIQLGHSGRKARARRPWEGDGPLAPTAEIDDWDAWSPVAPSAIAHGEKWPAPRALERGEVKDLVQAWADAARRAEAAGFDVLELHGAHGYLVHEFLSERSNRRADEYGGSESNRMRFITEVVEAVRGCWPDHKPLFVRLSVEDNAGFGPEQSVRLAKILKPRGVDVIDCSSGGITDAAPILGREIKYSYQVPLSEYVRRHADIMTMAVGLIIHGDQAERILQEGQADLIAIGREILNNPNWPMDAALKLGVEGSFRHVPPQFGWWLGTRHKRGFGTRPSTWQVGLEVGLEENRKVL